MIRKIIKLSFLPIVVALVFPSFSTKEVSIPEEYLTDHSSFFYTVPLAQNVVKKAKVNLKNAPVLTKDYLGFKEAVGFKESGGRYRIINEFGYLGKYQFGKGTLELLGIYDLQQFLDAPELQEAAFYANAARNKWILQRDIKRFEGKIINGVKVTESGILAAAHLAGPGSVKKYLRSGGVVAFSDAFGTSLAYYLKKFGGYDTRFIITKKNARVPKDLLNNLSE